MMNVDLYYCDRSRSLSIDFPFLSANFIIKDIDLIKMKDVRDLILVKDRAVDCLLYIGDAQVGKLAEYLIRLPDGVEIQETITAEIKDNQYHISIDKNKEYVEFTKHGEKKGYKVKKNSCNCMAWIFSKTKPKTCKHTAMLGMMGIELVEPPKKIVLSKDERKKWNDAFRQEKIRDKVEKDFLITNSQKLILDFNATTIRQWHEVYLKIKSGELKFTEEN